MPSGFCARRAPSASPAMLPSLSAPEPPEDVTHLTKVSSDLGIQRLVDESEAQQSGGGSGLKAFPSAAIGVDETFLPSVPPRVGLDNGASAVLTLACWVQAFK